MSETTRNCAKCGAELPSNELLCEFCGTLNQSEDEGDCTDETDNEGEGTDEEEDDDPRGIIGLIEASIRKIEQSESGRWVTFTSEDVDGWVEYMHGGTVNARYPHSAAPQEIDEFAQLLNYLTPTMTSWESGSYATFQFEDCDSADIARWIDSYFVIVLDCDDDSYEIGLEFKK